MIIKLNKDSKKLNISLIVMPFASIHRPVIGVSNLKSVLSNNSVESKVHYFNILCANQIGLEFYDALIKKNNFVGEMLFAKYAFSGKYIDKIKICELLYDPKLSRSNFHTLSNIISRLIDWIDGFLDDCVDNVLSTDPKIIGFTSMFQQNTASIALAKRIKQRKNIPIIFGGANCEGKMGFELLKQIPWIDYICSGDGEITFMNFINQFQSKKQIDKINGIITRESNELEIELNNPVLNMDEIPFPNFDDYFDLISNYFPQIKSDLVMETSRGCWWGEKFHCTFCGLNSNTMKYKSKSFVRVLHEILYLTKRYKKNKIVMVDNILNLDYFNNLLPQLSKNDINIDLFYETKANLSREQISIMKKAGISSIQPGIESLSDSILDLMKKGVNTLQNINLLKWCREFDIHPYWNLLWGFPRESPDEYSFMKDLVPLLFHLPPPYEMYKLSVDRYSPYFYEPNKYGLKNIRPSKEYSLIYPFKQDVIYNLAYHFEYDYDDNRDPLAYIKELEQIVNKWVNVWDNEKPPSLEMLHKDRSICILDSRPCQKHTSHELDGVYALVYSICDIPNSISNLLAKVNNYYPEISEKKLFDILFELQSEKLLVIHNQKVLSLATRIHANEIKNCSVEIISTVSSGSKQFKKLNG